MSMYDFFFPGQAAASHLRRMADRQAQEAWIKNNRDASGGNLENRVAELENDLGVVSLVLASLLEVANENGSISKEQIKTTIEEMDVLDGFKDGRLNAAFLRKWAK